MTTTSLPLLTRLGIEPVHAGACHRTWIADAGGAELVSLNPNDGTAIGRVRLASRDSYEQVVAATHEVFERWRMFPAPKRGEIVREIGNELRACTRTTSARWSRSRWARSSPKGSGEVQEMIDIADFAVGLSRQLYGLTMHSERPGHRMYEQWHPLGRRRRHHRLQLSRSRCGRGTR